MVGNDYTGGSVPAAAPAGPLEPNWGRPDSQEGAPGARSQELGTGGAGLMLKDELDWSDAVVYIRHIHCRQTVIMA